MGSDRETRALAAADVITVGDKEYKLRPVVAQHLADLEMAALRYCRRTYIEAYSENADLLGDDFDLSAKIEAAAKWTTADLPQKAVYDVTKVPVSKKMEKWILDKYGEKPKDDKAYWAVLATALDSEDITPGKVNTLTGVAPERRKVRFDQWWVTASISGMISFIRSSLSECSKEEKENVKNWPFLKVAEAARIVESLTAVDLGNG